jgi:hypothetical protein
MSILGDLLREIQQENFAFLENGASGSFLHPQSSRTESEHVQQQRPKSFSLPSLQKTDPWELGLAVIRNPS